MKSCYIDQWQGWGSCFLLLCLFLFVPFPIVAQTDDEQSWEDVLREVMTVEDGESAEWEEMLQMLTQLEQQPLDLNTATREELESLPFLTSQQVEDLMEYLDRYGPMKSMNELRMVESLDYHYIQLLKCFCCIGMEKEPSFPRLKDIMRYGRQDLTAYMRIPLYERKGDKNGYLGYPQKHWVQYGFNYGDYVKAGFLGAQDSGEPFFRRGNTMGYDFYSFYLQLRHLGRLESAVVGKYRLSAGMGLVLNNSFGLGKLATLQSLGRTANTIRAHSSRSQADYFQGAALSYRLKKGLTAAAFASYRPMDATLNKEQEAQTLVKNGYHRTLSELEKKNNTHATALGARLSSRMGRFRLGTTAIYTHLDRRLRPDTKELYRRYYASGSDFLNFSVDYGYASSRVSLNGETALNRCGALATINSASLQLADGLGLMVLQRFYGYRYTSLYAHSFSEGTGVQNESGVYAGLTWQPSPTWQIQAYTDWAYFAWPKYQVSQSSNANDHLVQVTCKPRGHWQLQARYRLHQRQRDNKEKNGLYNRQEQRGRFSLGYATDFGLSLNTQADGSRVNGENDVEWGWAVTQQAEYRCKWLKVNAACSYFDTDSYDSRLYTYERGLLYTFNFPMLYGRGLRYMLTARIEVGSNLMVAAKLGVTDYLDRSVTGSGLQKVDGSSLTDVDVQLRWKF